MSSVAVQRMSPSSHKGAQNISRKIPLLDPVIYGPETPMEDFGDPSSRDGGTRFFRQAVSANAFPEFSHYVMVWDGYNHLKYIGESMVGFTLVGRKSRNLTDMGKVSRMFQDALGKLYEPVYCWTSSLRSRAGLPRWIFGTPSPFTFEGKDLSRAIWKLLSNAFLEHPVRVGVNLDTTYHFEVGMIVDEYDGRFAWRYSDIERVRRIRPSFSKVEIPFLLLNFYISVFLLDIPISSIALPWRNGPQLAQTKVDKWSFNYAA